MSSLASHFQQLTDLVAKIAASTEAAQAEGLDPKAAAAYLGVSVSKLHQMNSTGWIPAPMQFGSSCPRWSRTELRAWMLAGAPVRARWVEMRAIKLKHCA